MVVTGGGVLWDGIRLSISEIIDPPWKHGDSISNLFIAAMRPAELILVDQEWPNCIICGNQQIRFAQVPPCRTPSCEEQSGSPPAYGRS